MTHDILLLLEPDFHDGADGPCYCPSCATIEGLLGYYPQLRDVLDIRHVGFTRPRASVIELLGAANQGLPALVMAGDPDPATLEGLDVHRHGDRRFLVSVTDIGRYLARTQGIGEPH